MNEQQTIRFLKAQREVMVGQVVLSKLAIDMAQMQANSKAANEAYNKVKAEIEAEVGGTINEETLAVEKPGDTPSAA